MKKILITLFLLLLLPACAKQAGLGASSNPFAATGLLAHPDETAEEILIRAHNQDRDAVVLAIAGYTLGIGGFPQDTSLSYWFDRTKDPIGWAYTSKLLWLMDRAAGNTPTPEDCLAASRSFAAPLFKQSEIFDLDTVCAEVGYADKLSKLEYAEALENYKEELYSKELLHRTMTEKELGLVKLDLPRADSSSIGHAMAVLTDKNVPSVQQIQNLLQFIKQRKGETYPESKQLQDIAQNRLMQVSAFEIYSPLVVEIIGKAHAGDPVAAWQMAENYRTGALGFPENPDLARVWLKRSALAGHRKALDTLVLWDYMNDNTLYAWHNAHIALYYGNLELKGLFEQIIGDTEKELNKERLAEFKQDIQKNLEYLKTIGYQTK